MKPLFSIVIATYNRGHLLKRALNSLLQQTEKNWEAWIIDDGSTDQTEKITSSYLKQFSNIHYHKQANQGEAKAKNTGIKVSRGEFVTFLDSDDEYEPNHLMIRKTLLKINPSIDMVHGGLRIVGDAYVPDCYHIGKKIHLKKCIVGGTFFIKRKELIALNGLKEMAIGNDAELFKRASQAGLKIVKTLSPTYVYHRTIQNSITNNYWKSIQPNRVFSS